jgi:putative PIN family toxin of toxin-antitoxin system
MVSRKRRIPVVLDTNVLVRALKTRSATSPNQRILRLWLLEKKLQLIVSPELVAEYLGVFDEILELGDDLLVKWRQRWLDDSRSTIVNLGRRFAASRDPDDDLLLATAAAGKADSLVTNDRDLLDLPEEILSSLDFNVVTPSAFLRSLAL